MPGHQVAPLTCTCWLQSATINSSCLQRSACSPSFAACSLEQQQDQTALSKTSSVLFIQCHCISQNTCELCLGIFFILLHDCWALVIRVHSPVVQLVFKRGRFHSRSAWTCWQWWAWELSRDQEVHSPLWIWNLFSTRGVGTFLKAVKKDSKIQEEKP